MINTLSKILLLSFSFICAKTIKSEYTDISLRIISHALTDSTAYNRLGYMCDTFGPRLSGSNNLENSIELSQSIIALPSSVNLGDKEIKIICANLDSVLKKFDV